MEALLNNNSIIAIEISLLQLKSLALQNLAQLIAFFLWRRLGSRPSHIFCPTFGIAVFILVGASSWNLLIVGGQTFLPPL